jgi:glycosyltransferase involved in cell wall biosynthesis
MGWDIRVLTRRHFPGAPASLQTKVEIDGLMVHRVWSRGGKLGAGLFIVFGLLHILREGRGAVYHAHDIGPAAWLAILAKSLFGGASVMKLRAGTYGYERYIASKTARAQLCASLRRVDAVHVVNTEVAVLVKSLVGRDSAVHYIPNGIDADSHRPSTETEKREKRRTLGIDPSAAVFLFLGRIEFLKGLDILIDAWRRFQESQSTNSVLLVVGDGPGRKEAEADAVSLGPSVRFEGERRNVSDYYAAADVLVLPSRTEGLSNTLAEAMANGLAVIASRTGGATDLLEDVPGQRLFDTESPARLAESLAEAAEGREQLQDWGGRNRSVARTVLDLRKVAEKVDRLYRDLAWHHSFRPSDPSRSNELTQPLETPAHPRVPQRLR